VLGTINMLERLIRERCPQLLAVAMDSRTATFRKDLYPDYKANRPPPPPDLSQQMERVAEIVRALAIPVLQQDGVEADDLIATAVQQARARDLRVVIVSADKDLMQLVDDRVLMWDTMRDRVVGPPEVRERFGVEVGQVRDVLALTGDPSDNVPGVPSVGPKTAQELISRFASLDGVYDHLEEIHRAKLRNALSDHRAQAYLSQALVTLKSDCPIRFDLEALRYGGSDTERLRSLYRDLGFTRLLRALEAQPEVLPPVPAAGVATGATASCVLRAVDLARVVAAARASGHIALTAYPASADRHSARLAGLAVAWPPGQAAYVPIAHRAMGTPHQLGWDTDCSPLRDLLADPAVSKVVHGAKATRLLLRRSGVDPAGITFDTDLAGYLHDPETRHGIADLADRELQRSAGTLEMLTRSGRQHLDFDEVPLPAATDFATTEASLVLALQGSLGARLAEVGLLPLLTQVEIPLAAVLCDLEERGVLVDTARLARISVDVNASLERLEQEAQRLAPHPINPNSPRQLSALLFDELGLKPVRRTKTSRSTDADTLEALAPEHQICAVLLEHRQLKKLKGTYLDALPALVRRDTGRIHTSWEQTVTATGRISSTDPNLQNIPIRTDLGRAIRSAFVAPPGHQLVSADYSQIELRVLAHLSEDPVLLEAFREQQDVHARTASEIFEVALDRVTVEQRRRAKAINFGIIYGQGESGLAKSAGITRTEASEFIAAYYRRYQGVRRFMLDRTLVEARSSECVRTLLGRRRLVPDLRSGNRQKRLAAERVAMNLPIQGTAADLQKLAMLALARPVTPGCRMILTVHDELVFEVPDAEVAEAEVRIRHAMEHVHDLAVPLVVDVRHGSSWSEAH
jgi:DNA polymerase-1